MGKLLHRLLFRHNIAKLALGQFLLVFAVLVLDPYPVIDAYYWDVDTFPYFPIYPGPDKLWGEVDLGNNSTVQAWDAGNPLDDVIHVNSTPVIRGVNGSDQLLWVNSTEINVTDMTPTIAPFDPSLMSAGWGPVGPWANIGRVVLHPGDYEIWVLYPAAEDDNENYRVRTMDDAHIPVREPSRSQTREYGETTFHLDCSFHIDDGGMYFVEADRDALRSSFYMMVVPERSAAYPLTIIIGWLMIAEVVVVKGYAGLRWLFKTSYDGDHDRHRYSFPPDVALFFAMGPEPNWKGGAFFRFPRGTGEFFEWEPLGLKFPPGMAGFFDLPARPP